MTDPRQQILTQWSGKLLKQPELQLSMVSGDASFRRYFRTDTTPSFIAVDAPPEQENSEPFIKLAKTFHKNGIRVPEILGTDMDHGFMLLEDFGDSLLLGELTSSTAEELYAAALEALLVIKDQTKIEDYELPAYDVDYLKMEMELFDDWFLQRHLELNPKDYRKFLTEVFDALAERADAQMKVCVHRDYHSRNLMLINPDDCWSRKIEAKDIGIIDFQDAMYGPVTYDLVSLVKDCYVTWPREQVVKWIGDYHKMLKISRKRKLDDFIMDTDLMGMQRHLKAVGIFCRLNYRDAKPGYIKDIPRTLDYIVDVCKRYPDEPGFTKLNEFISDKIIPAWQSKMQEMGN